MSKKEYTIQSIDNFKLNIDLIPGLNTQSINPGSSLLGKVNDVYFKPANSPVNNGTLFYNGEHFFVHIGDQDIEIENGGSYVPTTRTINGHELSSDITIDISDLGILSANPIFNCSASDVLQDSANTERSVGGNTTQIMKSIKIYGSGTVRLVVDWHYNSGYSTQGFWYKNGVAVGGAVSGGTSYSTITTDMAISFGDSVQFCIVTYQTASVGYCKNFKVSYNKSALTNQVLID